MRIDKTQKIELCASRDETRASLNYLHLDVEAKRLVAPDNYRRVVLPCDVDPADVSGPIPVDVLKDARRIAGKSGDVFVASLKDECRLLNGATYPKPDVEAFPKYKSVLVDYDETPGTVTIGINARYLWEMAQALGATKDAANVMITVPVPSEGQQSRDPIQVRRPNADGVGVLMQVRL